MTREITLGTDPEFCLGYRDNNAPYNINVVPPGELLEGFKDEQGNFIFHAPYGRVVADGASFEVNTKPTSSATAASDYVLDTVKQFMGNNMIISRWNELYPRRRMRAYVGPIYTISQAMIEKYKDKTWGTSCLGVFGCNPEFYAYGDEITRPDAQQVTERTLGGHIHMGGLERLVESTEFCSVLAAFLDSTLSMSELVVYGYSDLPVEALKKRRTLYGRAGTFRTNVERGLFEYRTGNAISIFHSSVSDGLFEGAKIVATSLASLFDEAPSLEDFMEETLRNVLNSELLDLLPHTINETDVSTARDIAKEMSEAFPGLASALNPLLHEGTPLNFELNI